MLLPQHVAELTVFIKPSAAAADSVNRLLHTTNCQIRTLPNKHTVAANAAHFVFAEKSGSS
jgi:hypothetical protein